MFRLSNLKSANPRSMSFKQIIETYNNNFELIKDYLTALRDKYLIETFTGSTEQVITLENNYSLYNNNILVFLNGVLQLVDRDYKLLTTNTVELVSERKFNDEIRVIIMQTSTVQSDLAEEMQSLLDEVNTASNEIKANVWAQKILLGKSTLDKVPESIRSRVSDILDD